MSNKAVVMIEMANNGMECSKVSLLIWSGFTRALMPMTNPILQMYDPNTFPIAKSTDPDCDARKVTSISGTDVLNPMRKVPIYSAGILKIFASTKNVRKEIIRAGQDVESPDFGRKKN